MAQVFMIERAFALVFNNAGKPGIRLAHPNIKVGAESDNPLVADVIEAVESSAEAIWKLAQESGLLESMARLQHYSLSQLEQLDGISPEQAKACKDTLAFWPKDEAGQPKFEQPAKPDFIEVCGRNIKQASERQQRPFTGRRTAALTV